MANNSKEILYLRKGRQNKQTDLPKPVNPLIPDENNEIVNGLKNVIYGVKNQDLFGEKQKQERICLYPEWKSQSSNTNCSKYGPSSRIQINDTSYSYDAKKEQSSKESTDNLLTYYLNYLTKIFNKIISEYKSYWEAVKDISVGVMRRGQGDMTAKDQEKIKAESIKAEQIFVEDLEKNFKHLIECIRRFSQNKQFNFREVIDRLEMMLLNHKIRGRNLIEIYTTYNNNYRKDSTLENAFCIEPKEPYFKFLEEFLNMGNVNNLKANSSEKNIENNPALMYRNSETPECLYVKELLSFPPKKSVPSDSFRSENLNAQSKTMSHAYHLIPSIMAICDSEDEEIDQKNNRPRHQVFVPNSNNSCYNVQPRPENKPNMLQMEITRQHFPSENVSSQWSSHIQNLQMVQNTRQICNGSVKAVNRESRKSFILDMGGNFGSVEIALNTKGHALALKRIPKEYQVSNVLKSLLTPLMALRHNNVLHYHVCDFEENELILATPLCEYNLGQYLMFMKMAPDIHLPPIAIIRQILVGLKFLHDRSEPIIHGNLKPSNTFIDLNGTVRIAEFGMHKALFKLIDPPNTSTIWFSSETLRAYKKSVCLECTCASDVQVAGMLIHFIITAGKHPYGEDIEEIMENLEKSITKVTPGDVDLHDLISWMLLHEPCDRPTINQILSHITFWTMERKWRFILLCAGVDPSGNLLNIQLQQLHGHIDFISKRDKIRASWVSIVKKKFPKLNLISSDDDTASGLLKLIGVCMQNQNSFNFDLNQELRNFVLLTFPALPLSLYRILQTSPWLECDLFKQFTNIDATLCV